MFIHFNCEKETAKVPVGMHTGAQELQPKEELVSKINQTERERER